MFDERHLQLTSAYAHNSELFVRDVILPLAKYIDEYIKQKVQESINKKLYWEKGKETYALSPDENGGWKWEKYHEEANQFVSTSVDEQYSCASTLAEAVSEGVIKTAPSQIGKEDTSITEPIKSQTQEINSLAKYQGLKNQTDNQTFVTHLNTDGKVGFSLSYDKTNKIIPDQEFITQLQVDVNKYLAESFQTLGINRETVLQDVHDYLKDCLTSFLAQETPTITKIEEGRRQEAEGRREEFEQGFNPAQFLSTESEIMVGEKDPCSLMSRAEGENSIPPASCLLPSAFQIEDSKMSQSNSPHTIQDIPPPPEHIDEKHWQELVGGSAIAPGIASINFETLHFNQRLGKHEAWDFLMTGDKISRTNPGRVSERILNTYSYLDNTDGWWCNAGVDPRGFDTLTPGEQANSKEWGCYKPDKPRPKTEKKDGVTVVVPGKFTKYEHPLGTQRSLFLLNVPDDIAQGIYEKAGVTPTESDRTSGFWYCVWKHNVPVTITEGAKKAASLLSQGHAAIGLAGINGGYYKTKEPSVDEINTDKSDEDDILAVIEDEIEAVDEEEEEIDFNNPQGKQTHILHPELAVFATKDRDFKICFDYDTKSETVRNVNAATRRTAQLLKGSECKVSVICLPGPDKGVDDFIVAQGSVAFDQVLKGALSIPGWEEKLYRESILRDEQLYRDQDGCSTINLLNGKTKKIQHRRRKKIVAVATPIAQSNQVIESMQAPHNHPTPENLVTQTPPLTNQNSVAVPTAAVAQPNQTDASSPKIALPENQSSLDNVAVKTPPKQSSSNNATVPTAREQSNADQGATQIPSRETNKESAVSTTANQSIDNSQPELATELKISPAKEKIEQSSNPEFSQSKQQFSLQNSNTPITPTQLKEQQTNNTTALISDSKPQSPSSTTTNSQVTPTQSEPQSPPNTTEPTLEQTPSNNQAEEQETNGWFRGRRKPDEPVPPPTLNWTKKQDVTLYQRSGRRRELEDKENKAIATAAVQLVKKYGIKADKQGKELTYQSDAFIINKKGDDYTISRRHDGKELMTFMANRWGEVRWVNLERDLSTNKYPINILPIERQEFLLVADYLKAGKELPRIDEDPRKLASVLSSVSPSGTHNVLESFKQSQVLQIMIGAIGNFKKNDLSLGNYRIVFREGKDKSTLQLFKTELNGSVREAVHFELLPTPNGMTHQVTKIGIDEADLEKLGSLARGLYINYDPLFPKLNAIRDIDLPVHPAIKKELDKLQSEQSPPSPPLTSASVNSLLSQQKREALSAGGEIPIRNSLLFAIHNSPNCELRIDNCELSSASPASPASPAPLASPASPAPNAEQSLDDLLSKLQKTGKLTIGEQRQLYNELIIESETQKEKTGKTDISLPPLDAIILDLKSQRQNIINDTYSGKVEIVSQSRQEIPQHTTTTNSPELEF